MSQYPLLIAKHHRSPVEQRLAPRLRNCMLPPNDACIAMSCIRFEIVADRHPVRQLGGRGFNSLERGHPATAPTVMQGFFSGAKTFELFSRNQTIKRRSRQFLLAKQSGPIIEALA